MSEFEGWFTNVSRNVGRSRNSVAKARAGFGTDMGPAGGADASTSDGSDASVANNVAADGSGTVYTTSTPDISTGDNTSLQAPSPDNSGNSGMANASSSGNSATFNNPPPATGATGLLGSYTDSTTGVNQVTNAVVDAAGQAAAAAGQPASAVKQGVDAAKSGASGPTLDATQASVAPNGQAAFQTGVAIVHGATQTQAPQGASPAATAGHLAAHGVKGAPTAVKDNVSKVAAASPAMRGGFMAAIAGILNGSYFHKFLVWIGIEKS
jgi:hypothetical protein